MVPLFASWHPAPGIWRNAEKEKPNMNTFLLQNL